MLHKKHLPSLLAWMRCPSSPPSQKIESISPPTQPGFLPRMPRPQKQLAWGRLRAEFSVTVKVLACETGHLSEPCRRLLALRVVVPDHLDQGSGMIPDGPVDLRASPNSSKDPLCKVGQVTCTS